jgi:hypothetical protein
MDVPLLLFTSLLHSRLQHAGMTAPRSGYSSASASVIEYSRSDRAASINAASIK